MYNVITYYKNGYVFEREIKDNKDDILSFLLTRKKCDIKFIEKISWRKTHA